LLLEVSLLSGYALEIKDINKKCSRAVCVRTRALRHKQQPLVFGDRSWLCLHHSAWSTGGHKSINRGDMINKIDSSSQDIRGVIKIITKDYPLHIGGLCGGRFNKSLRPLMLLSI